MPTRIYAFMLRLYPRAFRDRFGPSMLQAFEARHREVASHGVWAIALFWGVTCRDLATCAWSEHVHARARWHRHNRGLQPANLVHRRIRDVHAAIRSIRRYPGSSIIAVLTLGVGIGLVATVFSIVYGSTIRGLPFERPDQLVHFERRNVQENQLFMAVTPHDYAEWKQQQRSFEDLAAFVEAYVLIHDQDGPPQPEVGVHIDAEAFSLLRVQPAMGRVFTSEENRPSGPRVILLSHALWVSRFGADPSIIGNTIRVTESTTDQYTVVGVMPEGFGFPIAERFWLPLQLDVPAWDRGTGRLDVFGRLKDGIRFEDAVREFGLISQRLSGMFPATNDGVEATLSTFQEEYVGPEFANRIKLMLAGSLLVLLIACLNVANLLVVRTVNRTRELAIRTAIGASRSGIAALIITESFVLSAVGGLAAIGVAFFGVKWFSTALLTAGALRLPHGGDALFWWDFKLDLIPIGFALLITTISATVAGLFPALHASRADLATLLREDNRNSGSRRMRRLGHSLVTLEFALATALLTASALTVKSLTRLQSLQLGFPPEQIVTARVGLYGEAYEEDAARRSLFWSRLRNEVVGLPGVSDVALSTGVPMIPHRTTQFSISGTEINGSSEPARVRFATVTSAFFSTFGLTPISGRLLSPEDEATDAPVVVANESFASRYFAEGNPIGRTIILHRGDQRLERTIVGIVPDSWMDGERNRDRQGLFLPLAGSTPLDLFLSVRSNGAVVNLRQLESIVAGMDNQQPVYGFQTMGELIHTRTGRFNVYGTLYIMLGAAALLLSLLGLYGIMSFNVGARRSEIGIRMALGAKDSNVVGGVVRLAMINISAGLIAGAGLAYWITRGLESVLFEAEPWDPLTFGAVAGILTITGLAAALIPAHRATRVSPVRVLRES